MYTNESIRRVCFMKEVSETSNPFTLCVFVYCMVYVIKKFFWCNNMQCFRDFISLLTWIIMYDSTFTDEAQTALFKDPVRTAL
jgi:hypothetical protein